MEDTKPITVISVRETVELQKKIIDTAHEEYLQNVKSLAVDYATLGLPEEHAASLEPFIGQIRARYAGILNDTALHFSASVRNQLGALDIHRLKQEVKDFKLKANTGSSALGTLKEAGKKSIGQRTWKEYEHLKLILRIFAVIEACGYVLSFVAIGDNILLAAIWGVIISLLQTVGLQSLCLYMRDGAGAALSKMTKRLIWGGVALAATGLGLLRYASIQTGNTSQFAHSLLAPVVFILISWFLISVLAVYIWHNYPTPKELSDMKKATALDDEITAKETEVKSYQDKVRQLTEDITTVAQVHTLLIQAANDFYTRVNNHFLYAVNLFQSSNRISRTDNVSPVCFTHDVTPLEKPDYDAWTDDEQDTKPITANV